MTVDHALSADQIGELLQETSRTFALAVPLLPEPTRTAVGLAYLLFRIADTLEDAATWTPAERKAALVELADLFETPDLAQARTLADGWVGRNVATHAGYLKLMRVVPEVLGSVDALKPATSATLRFHARRTALGMRDQVDVETSGIPTLSGLREYCYIVAGIVGELLTEVFIQDAPSLGAVAHGLTDEQRLFGEGLQLVNILKDERDDCVEGRSFLPPGVPRTEVLALAKDDLKGARRYIAALERGGAPRGFLAFTSLPCELAEKTLEVLAIQGPGAKVPRAEVIAMFQRYVELSAS